MTHPEYCFWCGYQLPTIKQAGFNRCCNNCGARPYEPEEYTAWKHGRQPATPIPTRVDTAATGE